MVMDPVKRMYLTLQAEQEAKLLEYKMPKQRIRASETGTCKRATVYRLMGYIPKVFGARGVDFSEDGDIHHDAVRFKLKNAGNKLDFLRFNEDRTVTELAEGVFTVKHKCPDGEVVDISYSWRADGAIRIGNTWHVLEIKSIGSGDRRIYQQAWASGSPDAVLGKMMESSKGMGYVMQCHAVMEGFKRNLKKSMKKAYLLIKDRDYCAIGLHSFNRPEQIVGGPTVQYRKAMWTQVLNRGATIMRCLKSGELPMAEFLPSSKECTSMCNYYHLCHGAAKRAKLDLPPEHPTLGDKLHVDDL